IESKLLQLAIQHPQVFSSLSPILIGQIADQTSLGNAFFTLPAIALLGLILSWFLPERRKTTVVRRPSSVVRYP
ncbi:MAG: hypothetical protein L0Y56_17320, partial [Nitrospira sp.]|nr:hypothetical protein [Nitrospira sp.]